MTQTKSQLASKHGDSTFKRDDDDDDDHFNDDPKQKSFGQSYTTNLFKVKEKDGTKNSRTMQGSGAPQKKPTDTIDGDRTFDRGSSINASSAFEGDRFDALEVRSDINGLSQTQMTLKQGLKMKN